MKTNWNLRALFVMVMLCSGMRPAGAGEIELIAGWEGSTARGYGFISPVWTMAGGKHFAIKPRASISHLYYNLPSPAGTTEVTSPGASAALGINLRSSKVSFTVAPGYEVRRTSRKLPDGQAVEAEERGPMLQSELFIQPSPLTTLFGIGSYGKANRYTWARAGVKRQLSNRDYKGRAAFGAGVEVTAQGNFESRARQAGVLIELAFPRSHASLQLHAGYGASEYESSAEEMEPYFGLGFYRRY